MDIEDIKRLRAVYPNVTGMGNTISFHDLSQGGGRTDPENPRGSSWIALPGQMDAVQAVVLAPQMIDFLLAALEGHE